MTSAANRREAYEAAVRGLRAEADRLLTAGSDLEFVARRLVMLRNELKRAFRADDEPVIVRVMEQRNLAKYGHPLGPTPAWLHRKYGSWPAVIDAACRPASLSRRPF